MKADANAKTTGRKVREGVVISTSMNKTIIVKLIQRVSHPRYKKTVQKVKKLYAHDEREEAKVGDRVRVEETRPLSKLKRWRLIQIVEQAR